LGVISGAGRDHSAPLLIFAQQENPVERAALFEGSGSLQIIQLEIDLLTGHLGESGRELAGGKVDEIADSLFCLLYFNEGNVHIWIKAFLLGSQKWNSRSLYSPGCKDKGIAVD
jgi:hypothetical protein